METNDAACSDINAAMVLNDSVFETISYDQWDRTVRSKAATSWNLHSLLPGQNFMIFLASISGIVGNPGKANYAAGCTLQDALARKRSHLGKKPTSIDFGVIRSISVVAETSSLQKHFDDRQQGLGKIEEQEIHSFLDIICDPAFHVDATASQIVMGLGTPHDFLARSEEPPDIMQRPLFAHFSQSASIFQQNGRQSTNDNYAALFQQVHTAEERASLVLFALAKRLARALSIEAEDIDVEEPLSAFGVDSLVAVELRNWMMKSFNADVPVFEIISGRTGKSISELVEQSSQMK